MLVAGSGLLVLVLVAGVPAQATNTSNPQPATRGTVLADTLWSQALGIRKRVMVWLPPSYASQPQKRYPVAYYLHGVDGSESNWTTNGSLHTTLDSLVAMGAPEMVVVMPDGDDGFYTTWNFLGDWPGCRRNRPPNAEPADWYCVPWPHYDDYIARDLVGWVDSSFRTLPDRRHRGIAGLSMGGYGAVTLALRYPDVFSAAASHSGVLAPARGTSRVPPPTGAFSLEAVRGSWSERLWSFLAPAFGKDSIAWVSRDPGNLARRLWQRSPATLPAIMVDCGTEDLYLVQSRAFRDAMASLGVPLDYREHPGSHDWSYWRKHAAESASWLAARLTVP